MIMAKRVHRDDGKIGREADEFQLEQDVKL
jgi:hypothetical protein